MYKIVFSAHIHYYLNYDITDKNVGKFVYKYNQKEE